MRPSRSVSLCCFALAALLGHLGTASAPAATTLPGGFEFRSGGVDYLGQEFLVHLPGRGNVWVAIPRSHDLDTGPVTPVLVLDADPPAGTHVDPGLTERARPSIRSLQEQIDQLRHDPRGALKPSRPYLGEIRLWGGASLPTGWSRCDGRLLTISANPALFELFGNAFGGDGRTTLGLPDLRGRAPVGVGAGAGLTNRRLGQRIGAESVILDVTQLPSHDHTLRASNSSATQTQPAGNVLATASTPQYLNASTSVIMGTDAIGSSGSDAPHANVPPSTVINFMMATDAARSRPIFPSAAKWPVAPGVTPPRWKMRQMADEPRIESGAIIRPPFNEQLTRFTSGAVDYNTIEFIEHEDGIGTIWLAIPRNHDFEVGPVTPVFVLAPDVVTGDFIPWPDWIDDNTNGVQDVGESWVDANGNGVRDFPSERVKPGGDGRTTWRMGHKLVAIRDVVTKLGMVGWSRGQEFNYLPGDIASQQFLDELPLAELPPQQAPQSLPPENETTATRLDSHAGVQFTSGGVDYQGIEMLQHEDGIGTIWLAVPKNHDLETGPVTPRIVLAPDVVTPL